MKRAAWHGTNHISRVYSITTVALQAVAISVLVRLRARNSTFCFVFSYFFHLLLLSMQISETVFCNQSSSRPFAGLPIISDTVSILTFKSSNPKIEKNDSKNSQQNIIYC